MTWTQGVGRRCPLEGPDVLGEVHGGALLLGNRDRCVFPLEEVPELFRGRQILYLHRRVPCPDQIHGAGVGISDDRVALLEKPSFDHLPEDPGDVFGDVAARPVANNPRPS